MNPKIIAVVLGVLVLGVVGYFIFTNLPSGGVRLGERFDFGDAADQFPSALAANGARTGVSDQVWLGETVDMEADAKLVNADAGDDGVRTSFTPCAASNVTFFVQVKDPGAMTGTAYLNLFADWNQDGQWAGSDRCAAEWAVQNQPVDLATLAQPITSITVPLTAGAKTDNLWYRGTVTVGEVVASDATGAYTSGEVEDYGPPLPGETWYDAFCLPDPVTIQHGQSTELKVVNWFSTAAITSVGLPNGFTAKNNARNVEEKDGKIIYTSKEVDPPERTVPDPVDIRVDFGKEASIVIICWVRVEHDELPVETPGQKREFPVSSPVPHVETKSGGPTKTPPPAAPQTEVHPIQEEAPALFKY
ncbi:MAG: GEVED domain-containing protein [Patescibacteria group bacterium]